MEFCFGDYEGRGADLDKVGAINYCLDERTRPMLLTYCIRENPVRVWAPDLSDLLSREAWDMVKSMVDEHTDPPEEFCRWIEDGGYVVFWNAGFDRTLHTQILVPEYGFPELPIEQTLDAMSQAQASNLPGKLDLAGRALGVGGKTEGGKKLMLQFADPDQPPPEDRSPWEQYISYGVNDTDKLRDVFRYTRPLSRQEWENYHISERINDRGLAVDLDVCRGAAAYHQEEIAYTAQQCRELTNGVIDRPTLTQRINKWMYKQLPEALGRLMVKKWDEETGEPANFTLGRQTIDRILDEIKTMDAPPADNVVEFLELLQFGRSSSAIKFQKIALQAVDGRLCGSYVHNGAGQTGRFSSRGVQIHNLPRDKMKEELELLEMIANRDPIELLRTRVPIEKPAGGRKYEPVPKILSRLIRPTIIAPEGKVLVWGDWSAIEARVLPWLADTNQATETVLVPYEQRLDLYLLTAAAIFHRPYEELLEAYKNKDPIAEKQRQAGKVAVLALGFGGSVGAYKAMARGYGMVVTSDEGKVIVDGWRGRNRWARKYWNKLERAALLAMDNPGVTFDAGRVTYVFVPGLMRGTLLCFLPDDRPLAYPMARVVNTETPWGESRRAISYLNNLGHSVTWYGKQAENVTQATAASILLATLRRIELSDTPGIVVGHTHDEIIAECDERWEGTVHDDLYSMMVTPHDWAESLPLEVDVTADVYYHK